MSQPWDFETATKMMARLTERGTALGIEDRHSTDAHLMLLAAETLAGMRTIACDLADHYDFIASDYNASTFDRTLWLPRCESFGFYRADIGKFTRCDGRHPADRNHMGSGAHWSDEQQLGAAVPSEVPS